MNRKNFSWMALIVITLLLTLSLPAFSVAPPGPIPKPRPPQITSFNINNNAECTYMHTVTLNSVVQGGATHWRASEQPDFSGASWTSPYRASPGFPLTEGLGTKTVYFQVKNLGGVSNVVSDSIVVKQRPSFESGRSECDQPVLPTTPGPGVPVVSVYPSIEALNITIQRVYDPYTIDISYEILVRNAIDGNRFSIELKGEAGGDRVSANIVFATATINYAAGGTAAGGQNTRHTGRLTLPIPYDRLVFISGPQGRSTNIFVKAEIKLPSGFTVPDPNKIVKAKMITLREHSVTLSHDISACMGPTGDRGNWGFNLSSQVPAMAWVGRSNLDLHDCPDLKCDRNPAPLLGERVIRWEKQPSTADKSGTVHWACEGLANEMQGGQPLFRFTVKTDVIKPSVAP
jgi:hypothetical protein